MKKVLLGFFTLLTLTVTLTAQEDPVKAMKKAMRAYSAFNLDPTNNENKLQEAKDMIEIAASSDETKAMSKMWQSRGEIYSTSIGQDLARTTIDTTHQIVADEAIKANESFLMALEKAEKKYEIKDAGDGLRTNIGNLSNVGILMYQAQKYEEASANFEAVLAAHNALTKTNQTSPLSTEGEYNNAVYLAALGAAGAGDNEKAGKYFDELDAKNYKDAAVYDGIYKANIETNPEKAIAALEKGRKLFPDNTNLLFTEINYYLRKNRLDELTGKLQKAIEQEPENVSLYSTLGNVYDNLFQRENKAGNTAKEKEYFDQALKYYDQALKIAPDYTDAMYSIGALYYNKAAAMTTQLQAMEGDISKKGIEAYNAKQKEMVAEFDRALPYFQSVEKMNPNDMNTLIALKEIYAKKGEIVISNEFKKRLEVVQAGSKNANSYFEKN